MKKVSIISSLIFFLLGNVLISNVHYLLEHEHEHEHEHSTYGECQECLLIENTNDYILDFDKVRFSNNSTNVLVPQYFSVIQININHRYLSRAPPIS